MWHCFSPGQLTAAERGAWWQQSLPPKWAGQGRSPATLRVGVLNTKTPLTGAEFKIWGGWYNRNLPPPPSPSPLLNLISAQNLQRHKTYRHVISFKLGTGMSEMMFWGVIHANTNTQIHKYKPPEAWKHIHMLYFWKALGTVMPNSCYTQGAKIWPLKVCSGGDILRK